MRRKNVEAAREVRQAVASKAKEIKENIDKKIKKN